MTNLIRITDDKKMAISLQNSSDKCTSSCFTLKFFPSFCRLTYDNNFGINHNNNKSIFSFYRLHVANFSQEQFQYFHAETRVKCKHNIIRSSQMISVEWFLEYSQITFLPINNVAENFRASFRAVYSAVCSCKKEKPNIVLVGHSI